jgi:hypothetical protein
MSKYLALISKGLFALLKDEFVYTDSLSKLDNELV